MKYSSLFRLSNYGESARSLFLLLQKLRTAREGYVRYEIFLLKVVFLFWGGENYDCSRLTAPLVLPSEADTSAGSHFDSRALRSLVPQLAIHFLILSHLLKVVFLFCRELFPCPCETGETQPFR